jgi:hypothetical protein
MTRATPSRHRPPFGAGRDRTVLIAPIALACFVGGLQPRRAGRTTATNVPNPTSAASLSRRRPRLTAANTASVARSAAASEAAPPSEFCTASIQSALFIVG